MILLSNSCCIISLAQMILKILIVYIIDLAQMILKILIFLLLLF